MNPAQGSPPSTAPGDTSPEDRAAGDMGTDKLDLSPVRRCKSKTLDLPFSVESLISERPPGRSVHSPEPGSGCVQALETECASPSGLYRSKPEAVDSSDKETSPWFQASYSSPPSECWIAAPCLYYNQKNAWYFFFYLSDCFKNLLHLQNSISKYSKYIYRILCCNRKQLRR